MSANATKSNESGTKARSKKSAASSSAAKGAKKGGTTNSNGKKRLRPGELDGLVLVWMEKNADQLPASPSTVATGINRSSGAVGNCMARMAKAKRVRLAVRKPRKYDLKVLARA